MTNKSPDALQDEARWKTNQTYCPCGRRLAFAVENEPRGTPAEKVPTPRQGKYGPMAYDPAKDREFYAPLLNITVDGKDNALYYYGGGWAAAVCDDVRYFPVPHDASRGRIVFEDNTPPAVQTALTIAHGAAGAAGLWKECPAGLKCLPRFPLLKGIAGKLWCGRVGGTDQWVTQAGEVFFTNEVSNLMRPEYIPSDRAETLRRARLLGYLPVDAEREKKLAEKLRGMAEDTLATARKYQSDANRNIVIASKWQADADAIERKLNL